MSTLERHGNEMTNWLDCVDNPDAMRQLYDELPALNRVWLSRLCLADNYACEIVLSTSQLPSRHPTGWHDFNVVQIELGLTELLGVSVEGWPWERFVEITMSRSDDGIIVRVLGSGLNAELRCSHMRICRVHGYLGEHSWLSRFEH